jgi:hypothetical protein
VSGKLFHGSRCDSLQPGDIIEPRSKSFAHASRQLFTARVFGTKGAVYEVEAIGETVERPMKYDNDEGHREVLCEAGFRVVRLVPADEHDPDDHRGNALREWGYASIEEWAEDSDFELIDHEWFNEDGDPVNIAVELDGAIESSSYDNDESEQT